MSEKSHARYVEDYELAQKAAYKTDGSPYTDTINPHNKFIEPIRFDRFRRLYDRAVKRHNDVSVRWNELCDVYGFQTPEEVKRKVDKKDEPAYKR